MSEAMDSGKADSSQGQELNACAGHSKTGFKSCVFVTTPTSGTGSLWRIITALGQVYPHHEKIAERYAIEGRLEELKDWCPALKNHLYMYNTPQIVNTRLADPTVRLIINFRDPRDLACNQFYWALQHPVPGKSEEEIAPYRESVRSGGIDKFVLSIDSRIYFQLFQSLAERLLNDRSDVMILSYSELCLDFEGLIRKVAHYFDLPMEDVPWDKIEQERASNLSSNPVWIGQAWKGTDIAPGRYKHELQLSTIRELDARYSEVLDLLRRLEQPRFQHLLMPHDTDA